MKELLPYLFAILAGVFTTLEAGINANLGRIVSPKIATLHSLITGVLIILVANMLSGSISQYVQVFNTKPILLIGGFFGVLIVYLVATTIPHLGITTTLTLVIVAQVLSSLYIDVVVLKQQSLEATNVIGILLAIAGVYFIAK